MNFVFMLSANNFLAFWLSLELNLILFLGMLFQLEFYSTRSALPLFKYFIIQAAGSGILFISLMSLSTQAETLSPLFLLGAAVKGGIAPFHEWFLTVSELVVWESFFLLSSLQKLGPLLSMSYFYQTHLILALTALGTFLSLAGGLNNPHTRSLLAFSSVFNSGWLAYISTLTLQFLGAFLVYTLGTLILCSSFSSLSQKHASQEHFFSGDRSLRLGVALAVINLSGIPPFLGAYLKLLMFTMLIPLAPSLILVLYALSSVGWIYLYVNLAFCLLPASTTARSVFKNSFTKVTLMSCLLAGLSLSLFL